MFNSRGGDMVEYYKGDKVAVATGRGEFKNARVMSSTHEGGLSVRVLIDSEAKPRYVPRFVVRMVEANEYAGLKTRRVSNKLRYVPPRKLDNIAPEPESAAPVIDLDTYLAALDGSKDVRNPERQLVEQPTQFVPRPVEVDGDLEDILLGKHDA
jgi:hypothetical protein